jgi:hypothetical protein
MDKEETETPIIEKKYYRSPEWTRTRPLVKIYYSPQERGWAYEIVKNKQYRLANVPIVVSITHESGSPYEHLASWGDLAEINGGNDPEEYLKVVEKYDKESDLVRREDYAAYYTELMEQLAQEQQYADEGAIARTAKAIWALLSEDEKSTLQAPALQSK